MRCDRGFCWPATGWGKRLVGSILFRCLGIFTEQGKKGTAHLKMVFTGNVCSTVSLFIYIGIGVPHGLLHSYGSVGAVVYPEKTDISQELPGLTFERCTSEHGILSASSATEALRRGSNIMLSCWISSRKCHHQSKISLLQNDSVLADAVSAHILLDTFGMQTFECRCSWGTRLLRICGLYIYVGIPPDQPKNISCIQYGKDGNTTCSWEKGHYTYLYTVYQLQLTNGTTNVIFFERNSTYDSMDLQVKLDFESTYTAIVTATNKLGSTPSLPIQFTLIDIVKPHSPMDISVKFDGIDATSCIILWQDTQDTEHFQIRYQAINSNSWTMLENITARKYYLHNLKPDTEYEFQISCKFLPNRGLWSNWSVLYQTEAVPFGPVDVWYFRQDVFAQMQNITLFWKTTSTSDTRSESHHYSVIFQPLNQKHNQGIEKHLTTLMILSQVIPKRDYKITVQSHNSRGISPPMSITTDLRISAGSTGNDSILVTWEEPPALSPLLNGYLVEWAEFHQGSHWQTHPTWLKMSASSFTATIEHVKPYVCYRISVFALYQNRAENAASTTADVSAKAPLTGPHISVTAKGRSILVFWGEIPEDQQMGCVISYKIYVQKQFSTVISKVCELSKATPQPFAIENIEPDAAYVLWMTASTKAGESPKGNEEVVYINSALNLAPVLAICVIGLSACVCCVPCARQRVFSLLSDILPGWCSKTVPDPANSSWAKELISLEGETSLYSTQFLNNLNSFEEPEALQIEEVFRKTSLAFTNVLLYKISEKGGGDWPTSGSFQQEDLSVKDSDYNPSITNTAYDTDIDKQLLPSLYRKVAPGEPDQGQVFSEYLANPLEDSTRDYLPSTMTPTVMNTNEDGYESEFSSFSGFPRTSFLTQTFSFGGKLTLDAVRMDCNTFTD
ncbi:interleukin-12 receptor subunit beta-2 isoform X2 [Hemicordylus capensis]|uniref:interleukin-12 receptor subunit beta-2 isoform X2 n=1 Tax=Hemicordylus capensis TaxID=884348 RepID=UPI0023030505|nr:interleukin-12 receptor subunit beta-2 isoform X2 [Hemicordylus capensis]